MHQTKTPEEIVATVAATQRELDKAQDVLDKRVDGDEAARVALLVKFEAERLAEILPQLRSMLRLEPTDADAAPKTAVRK